MLAITGSVTYREHGPTADSPASNSGLLMNIAAHAKRLASICVSASLLGRSVTGFSLALVFVTMQYALARDIPMPFAPILALVIGAAWYGGLVVGGTMAMTAAVAVNFLLLQPNRGWSTGNHELFATVTFGVIAILIVTMICKVRASFSQLKLKLDSSIRATERESVRCRRVESENLERLTAIENELNHSRGYADSYQRVKRYAHSVTVHIAELHAAIEEFPVPMALVVQEDGLPVFRVASRALFQFMGSGLDSAPAVLQAFDLIVRSDALPFSPVNHPLLRALQGEPIEGDTIGWLCADRIRPARLFAKPVAGKSMLGFAIVPTPEKLSPHVN